MKTITLLTMIILVIFSSVPVVYADQPSSIISVKTDNTPILNIFLDLFVNILVTIILWRIIMTLIRLYLKKGRKND